MCVVAWLVQVTEFVVEHVLQTCRLVVHEARAQSDGARLDVAAAPTAAHGSDANARAAFAYHGLAMGEKLDYLLLKLVT